ncbi:MAG: 2'-5' RNA ligase family protein [Novosphingobium sp.]
MAKSELSGAAPFIVTAELPGDIFAWADALRRAHFPPERNKLAAHVTLFHSFAPSLRDELHRTLGRFAAEFSPPEARCEGLMDLGKGTALLIHSPGMLQVRAAIAEHFHGALTAQDKHEPRLHITVQNKVTPAEARALQHELAGSLHPRPFRFPALGLHLYRETHWEPIGLWPFRGKR